MFDELAQLPRRAVDLLDSEDLQGIHWRGWYSFYLGLEKFADAAVSLTHFMESGPAGAVACQLERCYVDACNDAFAALQRDYLALLQSLFGLMRQARTTPGPGGEDVKRISRLCHPKSDWLVCWHDECFIGRVSADGTRLAQQVLYLRDRIESHAYHCASIDISTATLRKEAAEAVRVSLGRWHATQRLLRQILRARCTIGDLVT